MPDPTVTETVVSDARVVEPASVAATVTVRPDIPSPSEVWAPPVLPSASTERSMTVGAPSPSSIGSEALFTVNPAAEAVPVIFNASVSPATSSSVVERVKVPDFDPVPAAIVTSNDPPVTE